MILKWLCEVPTELITKIISKLPVCVLFCNKIHKLQDHEYFKLDIPGSLQLVFFFGHVHCPARLKHTENE